MLNPTLNLLELVRLLAHVRHIRVPHDPPLQETDRLSGARHAVGGDALGFRAGAELAHDVTVRLQLHRLGILARHN